MKIPNFIFLFIISFLFFCGGQGIFAGSVPKPRPLGFWSWSPSWEKQKPLGAIAYEGGHVETFQGREVWLVPRRGVGLAAYDPKSKLDVWSIPSGSLSTNIFLESQKFLILSDFRGAISRWNWGGEKIWEVHHEAFLRPMALYDGQVFGIGHRGRVYALDLQTGRINWIYDHKTTYPGLMTRNYSGPIHAHGKLYVGMDDGEILSLDPKTGMLLNRYGGDSSPISVLILNENNEILALRRSGWMGKISPDGSLSWQTHHSESQDLAAALSMGENLFTLTGQGRVSCWKNFVLDKTKDFHVDGGFALVPFHSEGFMILGSLGDVLWVDSQLEILFRFSTGSSLAALPIFNLKKDQVYIPSAQDIWYGFQID